jgi:NAD(P)-dependent dehydrogenase (short-subunit alcohol dehydrogenase family)
MKVILVTGGNRGIGLEICRQLGAMGHTVLLGSRDLEKGLAAARSLGGNVIAMQLDVTNEESILNLYEKIKAQFGKLDVLINNAGIGEKKKEEEKGIGGAVKHFTTRNILGMKQVRKIMLPVLRTAGIVPPRHTGENMLLADARRVMETNFYGPWRMIQVFTSLLIKSDDGRIINVSSGMGELKSLNGYQPAYSLSKSSLNALTIMFCNELKDKGIRVNAMCPGWVRTDMGGPNAPRNVSQGADTAVWLATEKDVPSGKFFRDRKEINW